MRLVWYRQGWTGWSHPSPMHGIFINVTMVTRASGVICVSFTYVEHNIGLKPKPCLKNCCQKWIEYVHGGNSHLQAQHLRDRGRRLASSLRPGWEPGQPGLQTDTMSQNKQAEFPHCTHKYFNYSCPLSTKMIVVAPQPQPPHFSDTTSALSVLDGWVWACSLSGIQA